MSPVLYGRVKIVWNAWPRNEKYFRHSCQVFNNPHPCKFLPLIIPRRFPKFIFSRLWPPPIPHSVSCELIRKILKKVREREKKKYELCLVSYKVEGKFLLKKIWRSFSLFCFGHERFFRMFLMKIWKREETLRVLFFSICLSFNDRATLFRVTQHTKVRDVTKYFKSWSE